MASSSAAERQQVLWRFRSACSEGRTLTAVKCIEQGGVDVDYKDVYGHAAIHHACRDGHLDTAICLLGYGCSINSQGIDGRTPLNWASRSGHLDVCVMLLSRGADETLKDSAGKSKWFDLFGADRYAPHLSAAQKEAILGRAKQARDLGDTALHTASRFVCLDLCLSLIARGADPLALNSKEETAQEVYGAGRLVQGLPPISRSKRLAAFQKMQATRTAFIRKTNWARRSNVMMFLVGSGFRPSNRRAKEDAKMSKEKAEVDHSAPIKAIDISTKEKYFQYIVGLVLSNEGLVRTIVSYV